MCQCDGGDLPCTEAADVFDGTHYSVTPSLAANVIDTIAFDVGRRTARQDVRDKVRQPIDDAVIVAAGEAFTIKPLLQALPYTGNRLSTLFSRHATAHTIRQPGVCLPGSALVAVMLTTSLARQYG